MRVRAVLPNVGEPASLYRGFDHQLLAIERNLPMGCSRTAAT
jgi:hypothetical protein